MDNYLALKASAGSGKTFALSVRFVSLILSGADMNSIMALTFTNKAADEMKFKIIELFLNLQSDSKSAELDEISTNLGWSKNEVIAKRDELRPQFLSTNLKISTIDSFFSTIIKSFSLNLGISPSFKIANEAIFKKAVREQFLKNLSPSETKNLANFVVNDEYANLEQTLNLLESLYEKSDDFGYSSLVSYPDSSRVLAILGKMRAYTVNNNGSNTAINSFIASSPFEILTKSFMTKESLNYRTYSKIYTQELGDMFNELKNSLREFCVELENYKFSHLKVLLEKYSKARKEVAIKRDELTFFDITKFAHELLSKNELKELLYFRLDAKITHLLIDEFQDTSVLQYKILKPLIDEIVAGLGQKGLGSFFYVGDTKQSIYRFRGGVKELFDRLKDDYPQIKEDSLDTNFRSDEVIVEFVNTLFSATKDYESQKVSDKHKGLGFVEVISANQSVAKRAALKAKEIIDKGTHPSSIAILCWKNQDVDTLKFELDELGISSSGVGGELLFNTPYVRAVLECIKFYITKEEIYAKNVSSLIGKEPKFSEFSLNLDKSTISIIKEMAKFLGISLGELSQFILEAQKYPNLVSLAFANDETKSGDEAQSGVTLMTIHKSKGLQFDHLIVCDRIGGDSNQTDKILQEFDAKDFKWKFAYRISGRQNADDPYKNLLEESKRLDKDENLNKIYVALTRAVHSLIVVKNEIPVEGRQINPTFFAKLEGKEPFFYIENTKLGNFKPNIKKESPKKPSNPINLVEIPRQEVEASTEKSMDLGLIDYGIAFHYTLEKMSSLSLESLDLALIKARNRYSKFLDSSKFDSIKSRISLLINEPKFIEILKNSQIHKELPIKVGNSLRYIDLLAIKDREVFIIDYKTGESFKDKHIEQVLEYKGAIEQVFSPKTIKCVIIYILESEILIKEV